MPSGVTIQAVFALGALAGGLFGVAVPAVAAESGLDCGVSEAGRRVSVEQLAAAATRIASTDRVRTELSSVGSASPVRFPCRPEVELRWRAR